MNYQKNHRYLFSTTGKYGQRTYYPNGISPPPSKSSEIFIGNLPCDLVDDELIHLFSQVGPIYKLKLMVNSDGHSRGYAFITYNNFRHAATAILRFHDYSIRKYIHLIVQSSSNNSRLFFGNIPKTMSAQEIKRELLRFVDGAVKIITFPAYSNPRVNRGYAFVEFESHALAALARKRYSESKVKFWNGRGIVVEWAHFEPAVPPLALLQVKILYFKNIPFNCTQNYFKQFIAKFLDINNIERIYKRYTYAFVHFRTREAAEAAFNILEPRYLRINRIQIEVEWARPVNYSKKMRQKEKQNYLDMSADLETQSVIKRSCANFYERREESDSSSNSSKMFFEESGGVENFLSDSFN